jgi:hypothetical protein
MDSLLVLDRDAQAVHAGLLSATDGMSHLPVLSAFFCGPSFTDNNKSGLGRRYRLRVHVGFGLVIAGFLASIVAIFAACRPFHGYWQINPDPGSELPFQLNSILLCPLLTPIDVCQAAVSRPVVWSTFAANVTTDIYLIMIPLPLLWGSSLRLLEKIASSIVLGAGIFVLVCATIKTVYVIVVCVTH